MPVVSTISAGLQGLGSVVVGEREEECEELSASLAGVSTGKGVLGPRLRQD